jgi:hypothetical protein
MAKAKFPNEVGGVEIPKDVRNAADALIKRVDSRLGREALTAGLTLAACAVIAASGKGQGSFDFDDDAPDAPEPPTPPQPPEPPVAPVPPTPPTPPEPPVRPEPLRPQPRPAAPPITPAQAQAVADALGNVAQAALTRFLSQKRGF